MPTTCSATHVERFVDRHFLANMEQAAKRFEAYGWHIQRVDDANDLAAIEQALRAAQAETGRPSLILVHTHIGYGLPTRQDTAKAHGEAPGQEELDGAKKKLGWPLEPTFYVPEDVLAFYRQAIERGRKLEERRRALQRWADWLERTAAAEPEEKIIAMRRS